MILENIGRLRQPYSSGSVQGLSGNPVNSDAEFVFDAFTTLGYVCGNGWIEMDNLQFGGPSMRVRIYLICFKGTTSEHGHRHSAVHNVLDSIQVGQGQITDHLIHDSDELHAVQAPVIEDRKDDVSGRGGVIGY